MATFRVGRRVKLVHDVSAANHGTEGVVLELGLDFPAGTICKNGVSSRHCNCAVDYGTGETLEHTDRLEPLYDGNTKTTWESMKDLWTPERVTA